MIEEPFAKGSSIIHMLDPRVKIIFALLYSIIIALTHKLHVAAGGLAIAAILIIIAHLSMKHLLQRLLATNVFILFLWFILPFSIPGDILFRIFHFGVTQQGVLYTLIVTLKCNAIVLLNIALISTSGVFNLVHALRHFLLPDKLIHIFFFLFRYVNIMTVEYALLKRTLKARGFRPSTSMHTYSTYGAVVGTLLVRGHDRSEQIHKAMICRGFRGKYWIIDHFVMTSRDLVGALVLSAVLVFLGVLQWTRIVP